MKTYSLVYRECANCTLVNSKTEKEKNQEFFELISSYGVVAISDEEETFYDTDQEVKYDKDEYYSFIESVGNFYMCCFKNVSENNNSDLCNKCENPSYRFDFAIKELQNISDLLYDDKVYQLSEYQEQTDCGNCQKMGTTQCPSFMFWVRDYLSHKHEEHQVHLKIQRCSEYEEESQSSYEKMQNDYYSDSYGYIDYF